MTTTFEDLKLTRQFLNAVADAGYTVPTPVQAKAITAVLSGQHVIGIAPTGTGKTAAFVLPILQMLKYAQGKDPRAIILAPTKELVMQIAEHVKMLSKYTDLRHAAIYGGVGKTIQSNLLKSGMDIIVTTPRRLEEMYRDESVVLKHVKVLVIDEADRMLDMGFLPQLNLLLDILPRKKQNMLFSATFSPRVEELSNNFMDYPIKIEVSPEATPPDTITHYIYKVPNTATKLNMLEFLFKTDPEVFQRVMIFARTKKSADNVLERAQKITKGKAKVIHSNKGQNARINSLKEFKEGELIVLVATDVAARGIDIEGVTHVINFDVPILYEDYVHRIGRTGRANNEGIAMTFVNMAEEYHVEQIEKKIRQPIEEREVPEGVWVEETPFEEQQDMLREIDARKQKLDPTFKGAFHEKKQYFEKKRASRKLPSKAAKGISYQLKTQTSSRKKTSKHARNK